MQILVLTKKRVSQEAKKILELEFQKSANWDRKTICSLAERLDLDRTKVYKWNWDRKQQTLKQQI